VLRGGSFNNNDQNVRCANRNRNNPNNRNNNIGFRVVASTFFERGFVPRRNCPAESERAYIFRAEAKNGGVRSRPRPLE
jgi:hypothetical protein